MVCEQQPGVPGSGYADYATDVGIHVFHGRNHRLSLSPRGSDQEVPKAKAAVAAKNAAAEKVRTASKASEAGADNDEHGMTS